MPQRGRSLESPHVLKSDGSWVRVGFYLPALCQDFAPGQKDDGCGRP